MSKRKLAYWLGFGAISLLLLGYPVALAILLLPISGEPRPGFSDILVFITGIHLLPALVGTFLLWVARKKPEQVGIIEITLGGMGLFFSFLGALALFYDRDFNVVGIPLIIFASAGLLLASGLLFKALRREPSNSPKQ